MEFISILWLLITLVLVSFSGYLLYLYHQDRDKRKIIYSIGLLLTATSFIVLTLFFPLDSNTPVVIYNMYRWGGVAYLILILHVSFDQLFIKKEIFNRIVKSFYFFNIISFSLIISNLIPETVYVAIMILGTIAVFGNCVGLVYKFRETISILFLLSVISSLVASLNLGYAQSEQNIYLYYLSVYSFLTSYIFLGLIFTTAKSTKKESKGIGSYFVLKQELQSVKDELADVEKRYELIAEKTSDLIAVTTFSIKPKYVYISPSHEKALGYKQSELLKKDPFSFVHPDDKHLLFQLLKKYFKKYGATILGKNSIQESETLQYRVIDNYGNWHNLESTVNLARKHLILISRDVTERIKAEKELKKTHLELKKMNESLEELVKQRTNQINQLLLQKDEFIHQLGHDLKNPLGPLLNLLPILNKRCTDLNDKEIIETLQRNVGYMKNLVKNTLELARLNSPNTQLNIERINVSELVNNVLKNNIFMFKEKSIHIDNQTNQDIFIEADKLLLEELFNNLYNNAVKYSPINGTIHIKSSIDANKIIISIQDEGIGMTKNQIDHIFDEFYKVDSSRHEFDSSGLGMPICKRIVEKHNGSLWVESKGLEKGTTFFIGLPATFCEQKPIESYSNIINKIDNLL